MQKANLVKLEKLLKSKKAIVVNNKFIKRVLGLDDMRDFYKMIGDFSFIKRTYLGLCH